MPSQQRSVDISSPTARVQAPQMLLREVRGRKRTISFGLGCYVKVTISFTSDISSIMKLGASSCCENQTDMFLSVEH